MGGVPLPFGKSALRRQEKAIEKHFIPSQSAYARYSAPGDTLRNVGPCWAQRPLWLHVVVLTSLCILPVLAGLIKFIN
jgi:hypothetical protein